jgi:glycolate dehydrogenase FAD-binding subunit
MTASEVVLERPASASEVAERLAQGRVTRAVGGRTKLEWGAVGSPVEIELSTERLDTLVEHNEGDLTAVLQAGVRLDDAQQAFARAGQRLALDPPDPGGRATIGGVIATGDSGPLRHRYGAIRDLILGIQVASADGSLARAGSRVIKNVAGYDLAKLMCGSLGTLGVICEAIVRLHPKPAQTVTVLARGSDSGALARAAGTLARRPLELEALDVRWEGEAGAVLAQAGGHAAAPAAEAVADLVRSEGLETELLEDDLELWESQRMRQRDLDGERAIVRVSFPPAELERVLSAAPSAVARAGAGLAWIAIDPDPAVLDSLRASVSPCACVLLDAPAALRREVDPWGVEEGPELALMRRVKARFDPDGICNRGRFVGGL